MSILQISLPIIPTPTHSLSFLSSQNPLSLLPLRPTAAPTRLLLQIRNGGGPRTFPGGVSKWQWKRMQAKKSKQLLKARLAREREVYEMRKRAELKAAVAELERPWEAVAERAPRLFSVSADEQVKALADRFQRPGGFDMWSERDGPQLFSTIDGLPSARFFPKGVVYSTKPYGKIGENSNIDEKLSLTGSFSEGEDDVETNGYRNSGRFSDSSSSERKFRNNPRKKNGENPNLVEKLELRSPGSDIEDDVENNGNKNFNRVRNSFNGEGQNKANKWIKNPKDRKEMINSNGKFRKQPSQKIGKNSRVTERLSLPSSLSRFDNDMTRNGYENSDRFRDNLSNGGQVKANKWTQSSMDRNGKIDNNSYFRNKSFEKSGGNTKIAGNLSFRKSFSEFEGRVERDGYKISDRFRDGGENHIKANKSTNNFINRYEKSYSGGNFRNKGSLGRFAVEKSNTYNEVRDLSSEVYDMNLRDDGSYEFEL